jgi:purine catabolism regulator
MLPTLADVLELAAVRRADPHVLAGAGHLDRRVRWVHVSEVADIAHLLEGGELILTTGIALPDSRAALAHYIEDLSAAGVSGLAVELGRRYRDALPADLVAAAERSGLPLIELRRETPFVATTQAVHTLILDVRMQELIASDEAHRAFTQLSISGQGPQQVVDHRAPGHPREPDPSGPRLQLPGRGRARGARGMGEPGALRQGRRARGLGVRRRRHSLGRQLGEAGDAVRAATHAA